MGLYRWHPLAITLAELCVQTEGSLVERAWASIEDNYEFVANNIADGKSGTLFRKCMFVRYSILGANLIK